MLRSWRAHYTFEDIPINLWSVVRGGDHPMACPVPPIPGVFLY